MANFNPRTPRGVRPGGSQTGTGKHEISIHAPREGCDQRRPLHPFGNANFNPRTPRGVRPRRRLVLTPCANFNPRTPRGVRHSKTGEAPQLNGFQSTHPARGATARMETALQERLAFQSTHPARGATPAALCASVTSRRFQSTHPARGATHLRLFQIKKLIISIHAPREGCDVAAMTCPGAIPLFQSTHPARGATPLVKFHIPDIGYFNPRTPRGVRL